MGILAFILIGLIAGLVARALMPGKQAMGLIATALLGMAGSLLGGMIGSLFTANRRLFDLQPSGLILSVVGAFAVLWLVSMAGRRRVRV